MFASQVEFSGHFQSILFHSGYGKCIVAAVTGDRALCPAQCYAMPSPPAQSLSSCISVQAVFCWIYTGLTIS